MELLFEILKNVVAKALARQAVLNTESFFQRRRVLAKIEETIATVLESLAPFFLTEKIDEDGQRVIFEVFQREIDRVLEEPAEIFEASFDGQKLYDKVYANGNLPRDVVDFQLEQVYSLVFPQLSNLIFALPPIVSQWKAEGYRENFKRLDDISQTLGSIGRKLDASSEAVQLGQDKLLARIRQNISQRVDFQLELTGLRGERPDALPLEKLFVEPEVIPLDEKKERKKKLDGERQSKSPTLLERFSARGCRMLLVGSPGSGKTTFCLWLQRQLLIDSAQWLAVRFRLREISQRPALPSLHDLMRESAGTHNKDELDIGSVRKWLAEDNVIVMLDGFDEVPPSNERKLKNGLMNLVWR